MEKEEQIIKNEKGCPCSRDCCNKPEIHQREHECSPGFCEECYCLECDSCGSGCCCEL